MEKKEDNTFLYAFLVVVFIFLAGIAFIVTRPNSSENSQEEIQNQTDDSENNSSNDEQQLDKKFPSQILDIFQNITSRDEFNFVSQSNFRSFVENDEETSTKNFASAVQFSFQGEILDYSSTKRDGNVRSEQRFVFENNALFELRTEEDMVLVEDENFVSNLINAKDQIKEPSYFFVDEKLIQNISLEEDNGNDVITVLLVDNGVLELVDQGLTDSIKNYFKVENIDISATDSEVKYIISEKSLIREINIDEITVEIDSSRSFSVRDFKTVVEYSL